MCPTCLSFLLSPPLKVWTTVFFLLYFLLSSLFVLCLLKFSLAFHSILPLISSYVYFPQTLLLAESSFLCPILLASFFYSHSVCLKLSTFVFFNLHSLLGLLPKVCWSLSYFCIPPLSSLHFIVFIFGEALHVLSYSTFFSFFLPLLFVHRLQGGEC